MSDHTISDNDRAINRASIIAAPQTKQVLQLMMRDGRISRLTAMHYGIANLTARIAELRTQFGVTIYCVEKRDDEGRRYGTWTLNRPSFLTPTTLVVTPEPSSPSSAA